MLVLILILILILINTNAKTKTNVSVQYSGGLLPDIILLTQGYYQWGTHLNTM